MKSSAEDPRTQKEEPDAVSQDEVTDEFVDEVSESLLEGDAVATAEAEEGEGEDGRGREPERKKRRSKTRSISKATFQDRIGRPT